jgi:hypothetical protein
MPKKGKLNQAEAERESSKQFMQLRHLHSAVESDINTLKHHRLDGTGQDGLNCCPDKGRNHFRCYAALGILSLNLHRLGNVLLEKDYKANTVKAQRKQLGSNHRK